MSRRLFFTEVTSASKTPVTEGEEFWKAVVQSKKEKSEVTTFGLQAHRLFSQWRRLLLWTVRPAEYNTGSLKVEYAQPLEVTATQ